MGTALKRIDALNLLFWSDATWMWAPAFPYQWPAAVRLMKRSRSDAGSVSLGPLLQSVCSSRWQAPGPLCYGNCCHSKLAELVLRTPP